MPFYVWKMICIHTFLFILQLNKLCAKYRSTLFWVMGRRQCWLPPWGWAGFLMGWSPWPRGRLANFLKCHPWGSLDRAVFECLQILADLAGRMSRFQFIWKLAILVTLFIFDQYLLTNLRKPYSSIKFLSFFSCRWVFVWWQMSGVRIL